MRLVSECFFYRYITGPRRKDCDIGSAGTANSIVRTHDLGKLRTFAFTWAPRLTNATSSLPVPKASANVDS